MSVRVVTHCYAKELPQYAVFLRYHIAGFHWDPPTEPVTVEVCCTEDDENTMRVLENLLAMKLTCPKIEVRHLEPGLLWRRSVGRNLAALSSKEDYVWFCDVDQVSTGAFLDDIPRGFRKNPTAAMIYPRFVKLHLSHRIGDELVASTTEDLPKIDPSLFLDRKYRKAIGGVQIVRGDFARHYGYLNHDDKWQKPVSLPFSNFRDDVQYRKFIREQRRGIFGVYMPPLYRLRHTETTHE